MCGLASGEWLAIVGPSGSGKTTLLAILGLLDTASAGTFVIDGRPVLDLSPFQPVERDFAFVVDRNVKAGDIVRTAQSVDRKLIAGVSVFDVYEGEGIASGKKSVAIAVTIQPREKTMTDQEIEALGAKIVAEVAKRTGGMLRA